MNTFSKPRPLDLGTLLHAVVDAAKHLLAEIGRRGPTDVASLCAEAIASRRNSAEGQEGMRAFLEKRKPSWITDRTP